jgi:trehalose 6-phosphate phosphatase
MNAVMKAILEPANQDELRALVQTRLLVGFDFDGTLAPIVARPQAAALRASTVPLFRALAERYPLAIITGRARADVVGRLPQTEGLHVIGNHGIELWRGSHTISIEVRRWLQWLRPVLADVHGIAFEDKGHSLAIHYRRATHKTTAARAIAAALAHLRGARVVSGKLVFDVMPRSPANKGSAFERLRKSLGCKTALFVGDDTTDEDVFVRGREGSMLTIRIGRSPKSAAAYYLPRQDRIDAFLSLLLDLRPGERSVTSRQPLVERRRRRALPLLHPVGASKA